MEVRVLEKGTRNRGEDLDTESALLKLRSWSVLKPESPGNEIKAETGMEHDEERILEKNARNGGEELETAAQSLHF